MTLRASRLLLTVPLLVLVSQCLLVASTDAAGCLNANIRLMEVYAQRLPDCRAYEQVSPTEKNLTDVQGTGGQVWSSPSGEGVTFFSLLPLPVGVGAGEFSTYVASRDQGSEKWAYEGLLPPSNPGEGAIAFVVSENLATSLVSVGPQGPLLATGGQFGEEDTYVHVNGTKSYQFLAAGEAEVVFADSTPGGSRIIFEDKAKLTGGAGEFFRQENATNLYEWENGEVSLVDVLPNGYIPAQGATAGPGGNALTEEEAGETPSELPGGATRGFYTHNTISEDGSRVFFTDVETGRIYMREPQNDPPNTIEVSQGSGPAYWRTATPDGSYVFYTEGQGEDRNLYRFNVTTRRTEALTSGAAQVLGTLGISSDGSYVYFVADGELASGAVAGRPNLYELHVGEKPVFIASLGIPDEADWTEIPTGPGPAQGRTSSRVTPSGTAVLFTSHEELAGYRNPKNVGEIYLYNATEDKLTCVSCNPRGTAPISEAQLTDHSMQGPPSANAFLTRNIATEGARVFFQSAESLLPEDTNGQMDVYEWETEGTGSCADGGGNGSGGCVYLISTGQSPSESYFGDASVDGSDVFFFTRQSLVGQDRDDNADLYDAREEGGFASQNHTSPLPCEGEGGCRSQYSSVPVLGVPSSATVVGAGNLEPPAEPKPGVKPNTTTPTQAQKLATALNKCKKKSTSKERRRCRARARKTYGAKAKKSGGRDT